MDSNSLSSSSRNVMEKKQIGGQQEYHTNEKDSPGRAKLRSWLHCLMTVVLSDGRTLVGTFNCTDRDANIILSSCTEYLPHSHTEGEEEARMLGLAMVPGRHVVSMSVDKRQLQMMQPENSQDNTASKGNIPGGMQMLDPPLEYV